jgi:hypothetical protein
VQQRFSSSRAHFLYASRQLFSMIVRVLHDV